MKAKLLKTTVLKYKQLVRWISLSASLTALLLSVVFIVLELFFLPSAWYPYQTNSFLQALAILPSTLVGTPTIGLFSRDWRINTAGNVQFNFSAKIYNNNPMDLWGFSMDSFKTQWVQSPKESFLRVQVPTGTDPYLYRSVTTPVQIAGQRFRVSLEMRSQLPIASQGCRGVWIQENGGSYTSQCFPVALSEQWKTFNFEWQAPTTALSKSVRVVINDFDGLELDIRKLRIDWRVAGNWVALNPLEPTGAVMYLDWLGRDKNEVRPYISLTTDGLWHKYSITTKLPTATKLTAIAFLQPGFHCELLNVQIKVPGNDPYSIQTLLTQPFRSAIWFGDPNIAGHSLAALALFTVFLAPNIWIGALGLILGFVGIFFTESRAAWLAGGIGLPWLFWFLLAESQRKWFVGAVLIVILVTIYTGNINSFGRLFTTDQIGVTRQDIWSVAWHSIIQHPWTGIGNDQFSKIYTETYPTIPIPITHAHNFWLQSGVRFGFFGLIISIGLSLVLIAFFWQYGRWRALAFLLAIFVMNVLDYSLEYIGVLLPLLLGSIWILINPILKTRDENLR